METTQATVAEMDATIGDAIERVEAQALLVAEETATVEARRTALEEARRIVEDRVVGVTAEDEAASGEFARNVAGIFGRRANEEAPEFDVASVQTIEIGDSVTIEVEELRVLQLDVIEDATYRIDVRAGADADGEDAYLYLYRRQQGDGMERVAVDDDGGEGLNARLQLSLAPGVYFVMVEEFLGRRATFTVLVEEIGPAA